MASIEAPAVAGTRDEAGYTRGYRAWLLFLLAVINMLNLADRQGMAASAPALKADLHLSDTQLGLIQGFGFAVFYTLLGLPIARLCERRSRTRIIALGIGAFAICVALCSQARNFAHILLARIGVGVGDAAFVTPVGSLTGDHYPPHRRTVAMTLVWLGGPVGALVGSAGGGMIVQGFGWRTWFIVLAIPSFAVAVLALLSFREPPRGRFDRASETARIPTMMETLRFMLSKRSMLHVLIGCALAAMGMNGLGQFLVRFMVAGYGIGIAEAGRTLGTLAVLAMGSGIALGGFGVTWASKFDRRWAVWGPALGLILSAPLFAFAAFQPSLMRALPLLAAAHVAMFVYWTPTLALAQNMVGSTMRASSSFVGAVVIGRVGIGFGPTIVGILSDLYATSAFPGEFTVACPGGAAPAGALQSVTAQCVEASRAGIVYAIATMSIVFAWAAFHYALAARTLRQDLDTHFEG
jgi:predicted MFS family arabinose efflux permease